MALSDSPYHVAVTFRPAAFIYAGCVGGIALIGGGLHYLTERWHHLLDDQTYAFLLVLLLVGCVRFFVSMLSAVNRRFGKNTVRLTTAMLAPDTSRASQEEKTPWRSPAYTTRLEDLLQVS